MGWHIITGEYPPQTGGISDYTGLLAAGLAARGQDVQVWRPDTSDPQSAIKPSVASPVVHRLAGGFTPRGLAFLGRALNSAARPRILLVQYTPNALGLRGSNLPFCLWLLARAQLRKDDVRVMFHEPYYYFARQSLLRNALALIQRTMAVLLLAACRKAYLSTESWESLLRPYTLGRTIDFQSLPIPTTLKSRPASNSDGQLRARLLAGSSACYLVGHFGTYGEPLRPVLESLCVALLREQPKIRILLMGSRSDQFQNHLCARHPDARGRILAAGFLADADLAEHLVACDCVIEPYSEGVTTRRTSIMAPLALGLPVVTNSGRYTETIWQTSDAVILTPNCDPAELARAVNDLLSKPAERARLGRRAKEFYESHFSLNQTLRLLLNETEPNS